VGARKAGGYARFATADKEEVFVFKMFKAKCAKQILVVPEGAVVCYRILKIITF